MRNRQQESGESSEPIVGEGRAGKGERANVSDRYSSTKRDTDRTEGAKGQQCKMKRLATTTKGEVLGRGSHWQRYYWLTKL